MEVVEKEKSYSAELLMGECRDDYYSLLNIYQKTYDKANIAIAFCGVVLVFMMESIEECYLYIISILLMIFSVFRLICFLKSKFIEGFDCSFIVEDKVYEKDREESAKWMIDKYARSGSIMREELWKRQKKYDSIINWIVIALVVYFCIFILDKVIVPLLG